MYQNLLSAVDISTLDLNLIFRLVYPYNVSLPSHI